MTKFLANCEIEAHLSLKEGVVVLRYDHPLSRYTVFLRDLSADPGKAAPLMSALISFEAMTIQEAGDVAGDCLRDFMDYLAFTSNSTFKFHRVVQVFNWEQGDGMRECFYFVNAPHHDVPVAVLDNGVLQTVALLQEQEVDPRLRRCLKWFRSGIVETNPDDQFLYFWLVIEILAQVLKDVAPVPDRCPTCSTSLHCPTCDATPVHRPFAKQSIQQLFAKYVGNGWEDFCGKCMDIRNRLTHGDERKTIEQALGIDLPEVVDSLGRLAWNVIINQFVPGMVGKQVSFIQTNRYVHMNLSVGAHMQVGFRPNFDDPKPEDFPKIDLSMQFKDAKTKDGETQAV